ncbi:hypothetical protein COW53_05400 [bacterium CG17_big_fil_post_rev_8_21_14_2_50_64_8]|nr:MAG: hypothetical protein COW53_05400 [bacterium CG17_big_fil_post_rev_8_21_14_2_50_64_8]PJA73967.1 MAG: hypothetical protein CO151_11340 [bacterium CG_4_9_14_3_um_filter_65_15]
MSGKMRLGLILFGAGAILVVVFFALFDPNGILRQAAQDGAAPDSAAVITDPIDTAPLQEFLTQYNRHYQEMYRTRQVRRQLLAQGKADIDSSQILAATEILLSYAGRHETIATWEAYHERPGLPDHLYRQVGVARRLAGLRPEALAPRVRASLGTPLSDAEDLPILFRQRNLAAQAAGYPSWLDLMADDQSLTLDTWRGALHRLAAADSSLYASVFQEVVRRIDPDRPDNGRNLVSSDLLGKGRPGSVDKALAALGQPPRESLPAWRHALAFRKKLALPSLPASLTDSLPDPSPDGNPTVFSLDLDHAFSIQLPPALSGDAAARCTGLLADSDIVLACARSDLPPLLRGPPSRAMGRGLVHLYELAAHAAQDKPDPLEDLLRQAVAGPVLAIPLFAGAYLDWLDGVNRGVVPAPVIGTRFWEAAARHARLAPPAGAGADPFLPAAAFGLDTAAVDPLDDVLGWAIAHQLHRYICTRLLESDVHTADYRGDPRVADFLESLLRTGAGVDWQILLMRATGEDFDPQALVQYYQPLADHLASP